MWGVTATVDAGMLLLHARMLAGQGHDAAGSTHSTGSSVGGLMWLGLCLAGTQLLLAGAAALRR